MHWKLSSWQLPVQPVMKISSKWQHFCFSGAGTSFLLVTLCDRNRVDPHHKEPIMRKGFLMTRPIHIADAETQRNKKAIFNGYFVVVTAKSITIIFTFPHFLEVSIVPGSPLSDICGLLPLIPIVLTSPVANKLTQPSAPSLSHREKMPPFRRRHSSNSDAFYEWNFCHLFRYTFTIWYYV